MLFLEAVLVAAAQFLHRAEVDFVEGGEQRLGRLRLHQALGDARSQARHRHALLAPDGARLERRNARLGSACRGAGDAWPSED